MRVAVDQKVGLSRFVRGNMDQKKSFSVPLKNEAGGQIQSEIIVAENAMERSSDISHRIQCCEIAKISQVPDFIRFAQRRDQGGWKSAMGIRNHRDAENGIRGSSVLEGSRRMAGVFHGSKIAKTPQFAKTDVAGIKVRRFFYRVPSRSKILCISAMASGFSLAPWPEGTIASDAA